MNYTVAVFHMLCAPMHSQLIFNAWIATEEIYSILVLFVKMGKRI